MTIADATEDMFQNKKEEWGGLCIDAILEDFDPYQAEAESLQVEGKLTDQQQDLMDRDAVAIKACVLSMKEQFRDEIRNLSGCKSTKSRMWRSANLETSTNPDGRIGI